MSSPTSSSSLQSQDDKVDKVVVLYASETGNSQDTAERVGREVRRLGGRCAVISMDMFDVFQLPTTPLIIFITSTHGRGDPPPAMLPLWTALLRTSLPRDILEDVHFALFGLGDSSYEKFCYAGKMLLRRLEGLGANRISEPAWGDERAPDGIEQAFQPWLKGTLEAILPHLQLQPDHRVQDIHSLPPPLYILEPALSARMSNLDLNSDQHSTQSQQQPPSSHSHSKAVNGHVAGPVREIDSNGVKSRSKSVGEEEIWKPPGWFWAKLTKNTKVTKEGWWQDVREIEFDLEDSFEGYEPGSICCLQPQTSTQEVEEFLEMMDLKDQADDPVVIRALADDQPLPSHLPPKNQITTLRSILTNHLDIRCSPRRSFFEWLRRLSPDEREQERLDDFLLDPDEIHTYATRPSRTILETLADFRETKIPLSHLLEIIPPLRRRQFSIASSWETHPGKVQLLIALVEYRTNLKIPRRGLCSSWLKSLPLNTRIPIKITPPTLHLPEPDVPVILVGPGTGVAPMRALLECRVRQGALKNTALYFGCRSSSADLYYEEEWKHYQSLGVHIRIAISRDGPSKVYVQDLIRQDSKMINDWVVGQQGHLYICGSSNAMPREVREAVSWSISVKGSGDMSLEECDKYVEEMFESGRGQEESW
ncbi:NADPH-ferrihemoprotein reductase [Tremella mesenterica]|uniref:NADPH-dependent diflavin oxidoreductase 1 n=1 Tax=Tremella mesenterica TaxID=5217 RepID=A0A4Q1BC56_TREME|nr:uncharacterized protein TREMEDRAFT_72113 [Tremella mesenterica DSM 1558]EIW68114.1 hypothetical protein TREMEDRAFT_72113 [Tremella mesenterica DSM 1558]RXK35264.1 NADPH-ferrihemoprotein reductase [Tremella mesenterica]